ncbi:C-type lectin domain family 17, member A-like [Emydura macquarii macquarii]|uniref:C-type lectin domain family 17, member A-like n=1 Tax=Emydura macquarii macquarii TaxID=1129001 RepID=UPI00352BBE2F
MAQLSDYGNWMGHAQAKGKKAAGRKGVAHESGDEDDYENVTLENVGCPVPPPLPRKKKVKASVLNKGNKGKAGLAAARCEPPKTGPAISVISGDPVLWPPQLGLDLSSAAVAAAFQSPGKDLPLPIPASGRGFTRRSVLIMYVLLGVCFLMCSVFLTLALMKRCPGNSRLSCLLFVPLPGSDQQQESEELSSHFSQRAANASQQQEKEKSRTGAAALWRAIGAVNLSLATELAAVRDFSNKIQAQITELQKKIDSVCRQCPPDWIWFQRSCYYFSESTKTWADAKAFCLEYTGHLVIVNTKEEQAFLVKNRVTSRVYWLGLTDQRIEAKWHWVDGSPLTLNFWSTGEPNDSHGEDCGTMHTDGRWNDIDCHHTDYWICEKVWLC